ncbi:MAG: gamma-glutamyl-gamma-aminobutyrate hydrolase family protein, partial [Thermodesulfobacteriota bacterium]
MNKTDKKIIGITTDLEDDHNSIEASYSKAIDFYGAVPLLIPTLSENTDFIKGIVSKLDGLLLPGSRDMDPKFYNQKPHPKLNPMSIERTMAEFKALEESLKQRIPVLGICGGMQFINVFYGGSLYQDIAALLPKAINHEKGAVHSITFKDGNIFANFAKSTFETKSYHHQAIDSIGDGLIINSLSPDGIIEGFENRDAKVIGIQWHPE